METGQITGYKCLRVAEILDAVFADLQAAKRNDCSKSCSHEKRGSVTGQPKARLNSNGVELGVVRTRQRTVLVRHAEREAPGVRDLEEVAKTPVTSRAHRVSVNLTI